MNTMVFASSLIKHTSDAPQIDPRELELSYYSRPREGLKDVARLAAALGGVALYVGLLAAFAQ